MRRILQRFTSSATGGPIQRHSVIAFLRIDHAGAWDRQVLCCAFAASAAYHRYRYPSVGPGPAKIVAERFLQEFVSFTLSFF